MLSNHNGSRILGMFSHPIGILPYFYRHLSLCTTHIWLDPALIQGHISSLKLVVVGFEDPIMAFPTVRTVAAAFIEEEDYIKSGGTQDKSSMRRTFFF